MALQIRIESNTGLIIENAYLRIDEYSCYDDNVNARVRAYVSKEMKEQGKSFIGGSESIVSINCDYSDTAVNPKRQIYEHMKTLEKYKNAIDC